MKLKLFDELKSGLDDLAAERKGKVTLRTVKSERVVLRLALSAKEIFNIRHKAGVSRVAMAMRLRAIPALIKAGNKVRRNRMPKL